MSGILIKFVVLFLVIGAVGWGVRRIWRDWSGAFKSADKVRHERDRKERARPDVVTLERQKDGTFRPPQ